MFSTPALPARRTAWLVAALLSLLVVLQVPVADAARAAEPVSYAGQTYPVGGPAPTEDKPQSKLWYNDGAWWALMRTTGGVYIHRLGADHVWRSTGTVVDERLPSTGDALWDGTHLYVGSRVSNGAIRVLRFSYDPSRDTYTMDAGFPKQIASGGTESASIDRDSTGRLWVTFTQGSPRRVYVAYSTTNDTTWSAPILVPVPDNTVTSDDISGIVAFSGRIGVMWSDQGNDVMRFAVHPDSAAPTAGWTVEDALSGPNLADDHLNLKSLADDGSGRLFAAVKTSRGDAGEPATDPSLVVLQRSGSGTWTHAVAAQVGDKLTRPQIALDGTNSRLYIVMSTESGGTVYYKSSPFGSLSFSSGRGSTFIAAPGGRINNASTTKQTVTAATGLVVLASDDVAHRYYHGELSLGTSPPVTPPPADTTAPSTPTGVAASSPDPTSVALSWAASTDAVGVTGYQVFRDGTRVATPTGTSFTDTQLTPATQYSYTVAAVDAAGNVSPQSTPPTVVTTQQGTTTPPPTTPPATTATFVGMATATGGTASTSVAAPSGATTGDLLVAVVTSRGAPTVATPAGWTMVRRDANGTTMQQTLFVRPASTSNGSTWTLSSAQATVVQVLAYRGVDTANPVVAAAGSVSTTQSIALPAVTSVSGGPVLGLAGQGRTATLSPAAPLVERSEITSSTTATYKVTADAADTTATGSTTGPSTTTSNGSAGGIGQTLALRPSA